MISYDIYLCLAYLVRSSLNPSMLLQMALFNSFYGWEIFQLYLYTIFFIPSSVNGHLCCSYVLAIVNSAAVNTEVHVYFLIMIFSRSMPKSGIAGSYGSFTFSFFLRKLHTVIHSDCTVTFPPTVQEVSLFSTPSPAFMTCRLFDDGHSD